MFLQGCVYPQGGRMSASVHAGMPDPPTRHPPRPGRLPLPPGPGRPPPDQADTPGPARHTPLDQADIPPDQADTPPDQADTNPPGPGRHSPPGSRLQHTVYERPVRILLECILVFKNFIIHKLPEKESTFSINADEQTLLAIFCFQELWRFILNLHIVSSRVIRGLETFEIYYSLICELVTISITIDQC